VGQVENARGVAVTAAHIITVPLGRGAGPVPEIAVLTNGMGRYKTPSLIPGLYRIRVVANGYRVIARDVLVKRRRRSSLNFVLDPR